MSDRRVDTPGGGRDQARQDAEIPALESELVATRAREIAEGAEARQIPELEGRAASLWADAWRQLRRNWIFLLSLVLIVVFALMAAFPQIFTSFYPGFENPQRCDLSFSLQRPSSTHWFGFDLQGCDYYTRVMYGARVSMIIGIATVALAGVIAIVLGTLAGYYGGVMDTLISRVTDVWFALPVILGAIVFLAALGQRSLRNVTLVLVVFAWPVMLRLIRSSTLETKEEEFVDAARALGASDVRIMTRHILPNAIAPVIVYGTIYIGIIIQVEATLSFLGVGLQLPAISWGLMINASFNRILNAPHLLAFPGLFLFLTALSFILMGDALRDALDPKLQQ